MLYFNRESASNSRVHLLALVAAALLALCGCLNQEQLTARTKMLEVVHWLMSDTSIPIPHKFDRLRIYNGSCIANINFSEQDRILELQRVLSSSSFEDVVAAVRQPQPTGGKAGYLELFSGDYSYKVPIVFSGSDMILKIVIPRDKGGHSAAPIPGASADFQKLVSSWCE